MTTLTGLINLDGIRRIHNMKITMVTIMDGTRMKLIASSTLLTILNVVNLIIMMMIMKVSVTGLMTPTIIKMKIIILKVVPSFLGIP